MKNVKAKTCLLVCAIALTCACEAFESKPKAQPTPQLTQLERDLRAVRGPLILNIYVISRADNAPFTKEDIAFINQNKPLDTIETRLTDDARKAILGMNIQFPAEQLQALQSRFNVVRDSGG